MSPSTIRRALPGIARVIACSLLLSALFAACLYLHHTAMPFLQEHLLATDKKTTAWIAEQVSYSLPFIFLCVFLTLAYRGMDRRDGKAAREKLCITILVSVLVYGALLPVVHQISQNLYTAAVEAGVAVPETDGGVPQTLMMKLHDWFIRLSIPLGLLMVFYGMRAARERHTPEEAEEAPLTVQEYNDRRAAEAAEEDAPSSEMKASEIS